MSSSWESMDLSERYHHRYDSPPMSPPRSRQQPNNMAYDRHHGEDSNMSISLLLDRPDLPDTYAQLAQSIENGYPPPSALETPTLAAPTAASDPSEEPLDGGESTASSPSAEENNAQPQQQLVRRTSMSDVEQAQRRASIKHIMADPSLSQLEKRRSIQQLMDGRQNGGRRSTIDSGMMNPYMSAREQAQRLISIRRSSSFDDGDSTDNERPITANTRHFSYTATAASTANSSINNSSIHASSSSNSLMYNNSIHNSNHHHPAESSFDSSSSFPYQQQQKQHSSHDDQNISLTSIPTTTVGVDEASASFPISRRASNEFSRRAIEMAPPCTHYSRNCHIVSPCCGATFGCRICHDDCPVLPPLLKQRTPSQVGEVAREAVACAASSEEDGNNTNTATTTGRRKYKRVLRTSSMPTSFTQESPPEHHDVDRFAIREVICRKCYTKQSSKTNNCINCGIQFGQYHCDICNLWMSNEERPYHCPDCGFCRVGGGENFQHCQDCGMCIDKQLFQDHNCKVGKYMSNCPVCQEDLFSSRDASHELPCGHAIHWHCFRELASHDSRCPMCKKTAETPERMKPTWDAMAMGIALQPVPPELSKVVTIKCNDCETVQENRSWHFLGVRCNQCESFNTVVERITMMGQDAHEFLLRSGEQSTATAEVSAAGNNAGGGGQQQQQQQQGLTGSTRRPARRRRATVDSAVAPSVSAPWINHRDNENHPDR